MKTENLTAYEVVKEENLTDIHSKGTFLRHKKTGARVLLIENEDENKVFNIAFRTPPKDSTGVAHILEHSVLCGSREFPLKDPFVELVKGSLNTFLNAMTYPDKTCYPVASCNDQDFQNLMHVYLDAVFYPNIYKKEEIFRQEGWNYHLEKPEGPLEYNGVVYNEMKGAFSSPDEVLEREIMNSLFPDTPYGCESGGNPENVPELTYEGFLDFHRKYYHPSNSFIYLYGNMDMEEKLDFIDKHYLSSFDTLSVDSEIPAQEAFSSCKDITIPYPVSEQEGEEDNTYLSYNMVAGTATDNLKDHIVSRWNLLIASDDFHAVLSLAESLYRHTTHILSFLPNTEVTSRGNADRDALVDSMEEEFTRASFLQKAGEMGIKSETASTWLKRMQKHGLVENVDGKGNYRKPKV